MLLEDVPGTAKTTLAKSFAASFEGIYKRIQFTPDLLPSDITGINYFNMKKTEFEFVPGPVFSNVLLVDEINRATPKTQAGLLECMEELQATVDGTTREIKAPFMVIATQNPIESMGVFPLPEAQLDRFLVKANMEYPTHAESTAILKRFNGVNPLNEIKSVVTIDEVIEARKELDSIFVHDDIMDYIVSLVEATRNHSNVTLGVSPRGSLALMKVSKGFAAVADRKYVIPDDVKAAAMYVLPHRMVLSSSAKVKKNAAKEIIENILENVAVPTENELGWYKG
jgi:MoxR-like ATPase